MRVFVFLFWKSFAKRQAQGFHPKLDFQHESQWKAGVTGFYPETFFPKNSAAIQGELQLTGFHLHI